MPSGTPDHHKSAGDDFRYAGGIVNFRGPFGKAAEDFAHVDFLKSFAAFIGASDLTHEQDHRC